MCLCVCVCVNHLLLAGPDDSEQTENYEAPVSAYIMSNMMSLDNWQVILIGSRLHMIPVWVHISHSTGDNFVGRASEIDIISCLHLKNPTMGDYGRGTRHSTFRGVVYLPARQVTTADVLLLASRYKSLP